MPALIVNDPRHAHPERRFGNARDAWDMGQSPETQAEEITAAVMGDPPREPLGHDGGWIDSADMGEDAPDDPSLPDRYR